MLLKIKDFLCLFFVTNRFGEVELFATAKAQKKLFEDGDNVFIFRPYVSRTGAALLPFRDCGWCVKLDSKTKKSFLNFFSIDVLQTRIS